MSTIKLIAACALCISASTSFGHENMPHTMPNSPVVKEQKDWGIAGEAQKVRRTITVRMGDDMRFSPRHIEVREGDTVRLRVRDHGIGFDMAHAGKLFQPFQRLHGADEGAGNGLGLAIAQRIAERHGGRISARSEPGAGATFTIELPAGDTD